MGEELRCLVVGRSTRTDNEMSRKQTPRLLRTFMTGTVHVLLRYETLSDGRLKAIEKWDVTADFNALLSDALEDAFSNSVQVWHCRTHLIADASKPLPKLCWLSLATRNPLPCEFIEMQLVPLVGQQSMEDAK